MQDCGAGAGPGGGGAGAEAREGETPRDRPYPQHYIFQKEYGGSNKEKFEPDPNMATYCRVATGIYEVTSNTPYQNPKYPSSNAPTFSSPPNSPLVGLVFDPSSSTYGSCGTTTDDRRTQSTWTATGQEPIGTGAKKKIVKNQDKRNLYSADPRHMLMRYNRESADNERPRKPDRNITSESMTGLDFFAEGERMVSELCNAIDIGNSREQNIHKQNVKYCMEDDKNKVTGSEVLLTALDKIVIHDQIPNEIVQLAIEACTDAENIAIAHHNRPCFKNIHSICAKTRSNVQKPDSAVANLHSQGIPWVIKNFIFSFVRILDGWKGVKELLSEKHDTFSRIENKYYSPNIRECFVQWQAVTKEMLTHIYKTFKCLDHGFTMEQKSFTHNYYATNPAASRHQNTNKFQQTKTHPNTLKTINASPQSYNAVQPPWVQNQVQSHNLNDGPWSSRNNVACKKNPAVPIVNSSNLYPINEQSDLENFPKNPYKSDPCKVREAKPRQSWTISNMSDSRSLEGMCQIEQREIYSQLKSKTEGDVVKVSGQATTPNITPEMMQRREMEIKAKMLPLSHVEKTLIPNITSSVDMRGCYGQKNNSCGDTKEESDFFAAWGQMVQKEYSDFITHRNQNIQIPGNVVSISNNIASPVQFVESENDEFHEISKVYMKPGSYKVPIKPADPMFPFVVNSQEAVYDNVTVEEMKIPFPAVTLAPQPKYNIESWPCLMARRGDEIYRDEQVILQRNIVDTRVMGHIDILNPVNSDCAWEAAKKSAPKLMDFIHEGPNADTARLYDALGFSGRNDECYDDLKQKVIGLEQGRGWAVNQCLSKVSNEMWDYQESGHQDFSSHQISDLKNIDDMTKLEGSETIDTEVFHRVIDKETDYKENTRCPKFDQTGNLVREENQKRETKSKLTVSSTWYQPKKKKPLHNSLVKKFENILNGLLHMNEAGFIQHDMDMKVAPRFYDIVKYPMCLHDIATKLKNFAYTDQEQVVQDFRRIFDNIKLYLKTYPDQIMKKNLNKVSTEFEVLLAEEFPNKKKNEEKNDSDGRIKETAEKSGDRPTDSQVEVNRETNHTTDNIKNDSGDMK